MSSITRVIPLAARLVLAQRQSRPKPRFFHWEPRYCTVHHTGRDGREWRESSHSRHLGDDTTGAPIAAVLAARLAAGAGTRPVLAPGCANPASSLPAPVSPRAPRADTRVCWGGHRQGDGRLGTWYWWRRSFHHPCGWTAHRCIVHRSGVTRRRTRRVLPCNRGTPRWALASALLCTADPRFLRCPAVAIGRSRRRYRHSSAGCRCPSTWCLRAAHVTRHEPSPRCR